MDTKMDAVFQKKKLGKEKEVRKENKKLIYI